MYENKPEHQVMLNKSDSILSIYVCKTTHTQKNS